MIFYAIFYKVNNTQAEYRPLSTLPDHSMHLQQVRDITGYSIIEQLGTFYTENEYIEAVKRLNEYNAPFWGEEDIFSYQYKLYKLTAEEIV